MAKAKFKIKIEEPCQVPKERLSKVDLGYYCAVCTKCVVDYRQYSDQQIAREFKREPEKERCGIFTLEQLEKVYQEKNPKKYGIFSPLLLSGLLLTNRNSHGQSEVVVDTVITVQKDTSAIKEDTLQLAQVDSTSVDSTTREEIIWTTVRSTDIKPPVQLCNKGIMEFPIKGLQVYGVVYIKPEFAPPPFDLKSIIDSTKTKLTALAGFFGFIPAKPSEPKIPKHPFQNNDRPVWLESLRHRFRRKKK